MEVLWPPRHKPGDLTVNDTSLVVRVTCGDKSVLLTGDLDQHGQEQLSSHPARLRANVLMLPHHGGWETSLPGFVEAVDPDVVLVSSRRDPATDATAGGERAELYDRIRWQRRYHTTSRDGWICVHFGQGKLRVETMRQRRDTN